MNIPTLNRGFRLEILIGLLFMLVSCANPTVNQGLKTTTEDPNKLLAQTQETQILLNFEQSPPPLKSEPLIKNPGLTTVIGPTTGSTPEPAVVRTSTNPHAGLWCAETLVLEGHRLNYHSSKPLDVRKYDTISLYIMQPRTPDQNGQITAAVYLEDSAGRRLTGDAYPITNAWQQIPLDLKSASKTASLATQPLTLDQITNLGVELKRTDPATELSPTSPANTTPEQTPTPITVRTDTWQLSTTYRWYVGPRLGISNPFFVQQNGLRLQVGCTDRFTLIFHQRAGNALDNPWLEVRQGKEAKRVLGDPGTGLFLFNQDQLDALNPSLTKSEAPPVPTDPTTQPATPASLTPKEPSVCTWKMLWVSPQATLVEVLESIGPFDRLGRGSTERTWRFMIYPTGQVYLQITPSPPPPAVASAEDKDLSPATPEPVALVLGISSQYIKPSITQPNRLLKAIYPETLRRQLSGGTEGADENSTVLPHEFQVGFPVAMTGKWFAQEQLWFHATGPIPPPRTSTQPTSLEPPCVYVGQGIPKSLRTGPLGAMLLVNTPQPLDQATGFASYLAPPKLEVTLGQHDRHYPGDLNNDGLVDGTGFMPIQLAQEGNGRASWTLLPENRPIYYPAFLLLPPANSTTSPATPTKTSGPPPTPPKKTLLINIDGQQITCPPLWIDGAGYLVQLPWIISNPVHIEVEWATEKPPTSP